MRASGLCLLMGLVCAAMSQPTTGTNEYRPTEMTVEQVYEKFIEATGGRAAYAKLTSLVTKATMRIPAQNMTGTMAIYQEAPDRAFMKYDLPGVGVSRMGFDGKTAWGDDPIYGLRELTGSERQRFLTQTAFNSTVRWKELYTTTEMLGVKAINGKDVFVAKFTPKAGEPVTMYFDGESFLLVRTDTVMKEQGMTLPLTVMISDYRDVDGLKAPFKLTQRVAITDVEIAITSIQSNVPIDDKLFAMPKPAAKKPAPAKKPPTKKPKGPSKKPVKKR